MELKCLDGFQVYLNIKFLIHFLWKRKQTLHTMKLDYLHLKNRGDNKQKIQVSGREEQNVAKIQNMGLHQVTIENGNSEIIYVC